MPVLLNNYRCNNFSGRRTVYSKLKRITDTGFDTSNDFFAEGNFSRLQGLNDNSKDYFSFVCSDIIKFNNGTGDLYVACGANSYTDNRTRLSTFLYSEGDGVSWTFSNDTFGYGGGVPAGLVLIVSNNTLFCGGSGIDSNGNRYGLMSSTNGKTWEKVNSPSVFSQVSSMATNRSGKIVAVGYDTTLDNQIIQYSINNGVTWTQVQNISIAYSNTVNTFYAHDTFFIGVTEDNDNLTVYKSNDLTTWTTVTLKDSENNSITQLPADLNGVYYSSSKYILYLSIVVDSNIQPVFYSTDGSTFTTSTGINLNPGGVTNVTYNDNDSNFYLSVHYYNSPISPDTPIMYKSANGETWTGIITSTNLPDGLSSDLAGILRFFIQDSTNVAWGIYVTSSSLFGLVSIALSDYTVSSYGTSIALNDGVVTKLFHDEDSGAILVGVYGDDITDNTIYYYDGTQLVATEHQEDVS
jgi:hypothetical protein